MWEGSKQGGAEERSYFVVGTLEAGEDGAKFGVMIFHEAAVSFGAARKCGFDVSSHFLQVIGGFHGEVAPGEAGHGVEFDEVHVVFGFASGFGEDFVEGEFLMEKGGSDIEGEVADFEFAIAAADAVLFFDDGDVESTAGENHSCGESSGTCSHDDDAFFLHVLLH